MDEDDDVIIIKRCIEKKEEKGITGFLKRLEKKKQISDSGEVSGKVAGLDAKVEYSYSARLMPEIKDFPIKRGFHPRQRELIWAKNWNKRKMKLETRLKRR